MFNVSYSTAWNVGRALAVADRAFTTSLLRLRGKIHSEAVDKAQLQDVERPLDVTSYLKNLQASLQTVVQSQITSAVQQAKVINRWYRTPEEKAQTPARRLMAMADYKNEDYEKQVSNVLDTLTGPDLDSDWAAVRGWAIDQLFLAKIPLDYLITSTESLPRESIRTFSIDPTWVGCVIDGALSLANHFSEDDDVIRRALKGKLNDFLATPISEGPRKGSRPQVPKWGFFLRSMAVTAFPDLKVEVPLPSGSEKGLAEVTYMQKLSDDVIICLLDRSPGEKTLTSIKITQPGHQQGFSLGNLLSEKNIDIQFRFLPNKQGVKLDDLKGDTSVSKPWTNLTVPPIYHWPSRTILSQEFARQCVLVLRKPNIFEWAGDDQNPDTRGIPSSIVASQLSSAVLKLDFNIPILESSLVLDPGLDVSVDPPKPGIRKLYIPQKPSTGPTSASSSKPQKDRGPLPTTRLPIGPRAPPPTTQTFRTTEAPPTSPDNFPRVSFHEVSPWSRTFIMDCYNLMNRSHKDTAPLTINAGRSTDLLFEIKDINVGTAGVPYIAREIQIVIPVSFSSGHVPVGVNGSLPTLLSIDGTPMNPCLPTVEPHNRGACWLYDTRLALGTLFDTEMGNWYGRIYIDKYRNRPENTNLQIMLVVRMKTRMNYAQWYDENGRESDGTFLLNGVRLSALEKGAKEKKVDFNLYVTHHDWDARDTGQVKTLTVVA